MCLASHKHVLLTSSWMLECCRRERISLFYRFFSQPGVVETEVSGIADVKLVSGPVSMCGWKSWKSSHQPHLHGLGREAAVADRLLREREREREMYMYQEV
ncbi:unnamed protein product [Protopolystoma xenopodis]|uniref:Uncharacterized protein n=1 Tax=Protopolystoma xenopodis TaxID=117903 RepID=A0A3S5FGT2_9PLAT|nr:unnamed protein product [Protopolystoma xenopodis]